MITNWSAPSLQNNFLLKYFTFLFCEWWWHVTFDTWFLLVSVLLHFQRFCVSRMRDIFYSKNNFLGKKSSIHKIRGGGLNVTNGRTYRWMTILCLLFDPKEMKNTTNLPGLSCRESVVADIVCGSQQGPICHVIGDKGELLKELFTPKLDGEARW